VVKIYEYDDLSQSEQQQAFELLNEVTTKLEGTEEFEEDDIPEIALTLAASFIRNPNEEDKVYKKVYKDTYGEEPADNPFETEDEEEDEDNDE